MYLLLPNIFIACLCCVPLIPLAVGFAVELSFPVHEATACGWVAFWSNITSFGLTYVSAWLCEMDPMYEVTLFAALGLVSIIINAFVKEELNRLNSKLNK